VLSRETRRDMALHVSRNRTGRCTERVLFCRTLQRAIHASDSRKLGVGNHCPQSFGPCLVGSIADVAMRDLASDDARPRPLLRRQPSGNAKADDGLGTLWDFLAHELLEPAAVPTSCYGSHLLDLRGDARLCAKTRRGEDEAWPLRRSAHIPTRTEAVLEAFRLR
jgi:hypothetical protein